jgi:AcrR family transcriptional regulator
MQETREKRTRLTRAERRETLLDAGLGLFSGTGYGAVSIGEVASAAGVTKPVIYEHFESKADLYVALLEREAASLSQTLLEGFDPSADLRERLRTLSGDAVRYATRNPAAVGLLLQEPLGDAKVAAAHQSVRATARATTATLIRSDPAFEASPGLSKRASAELHAEMQVAMLERLLRWAIDHPRTSAKALSDFFADLLWDGLGH